MKPSFSRRTLKARARKRMADKYGPLALLTVLVFAANTISSSLLVNLFSSGSGIFNIILQLATTAVVNIFYTLLLAGQTGIYLKVSRDQTYSLRDLLYAFRDRPEQIAIYSVIMFLLQTIMVNVPFLMLQYALFTDSVSPSWLLLTLLVTLLLGVVIVFLFLELSLVLYLYIETPNSDMLQLIRTSHRLIKGNRIRMLLLRLSFLGLELLGILSFGIGFLFIEPYRQITTALFYRELNPQQDRVPDTSADSIS